MAQLVKSEGAIAPSLMTIVMNENEYVYAAINLNIVLRDDHMYEWDHLVLPDFALDNIHNTDADTKYKVLVTHIIKAYYDDNSMTAILNNYLLDPEDTDSKAEFLKMQNVRKIAKDTAKEIIRNNIF